MIMKQATYVVDVFYQVLHKLNCYEFIVINIVMNTKINRDLLLRGLFIWLIPSFHISRY